MASKRPQPRTGERSEAFAKAHLEALGLLVLKPQPDRGVDLEVRLPACNSPVVALQVKGRGEQNRKSRWFQIRAGSSREEPAALAGRDVDERWEKKIRMCDFFVLVALKYREAWVLPQAQVFEIAKENRRVYGHRKGYHTGEQAELSLDIERWDGTPLTEVYAKYRNAFSIVKDELERRLDGKKLRLV